VPTKTRPMGIIERVPSLEATATARLRRALIPRLVRKQPIGPMQSLFAEIFRSS
jgi:hypothetical protein